MKRRLKRTGSVMRSRARAIPTRGVRPPERLAADTARRPLVKRFLDWIKTKLATNSVREASAAADPACRLMRDSVTSTPTMAIDRQSA